MNMGEIFFECGECGQSLDAPDDMAGDKIACPACNAEISVPASSTIPAPDPGDIEDQEQDRDEGAKTSTVKIDIPNESVVEATDRKVTIKRLGKGKQKQAAREGFEARSDSRDGNGLRSIWRRNDR